MNTHNINYVPNNRKKRNSKQRERDNHKRIGRELDQSSKLMPLPKLNNNDYNVDDEEPEDVANKQCDMEGGEMAGQPSSSLWLKLIDVGR